MFVITITTVPPQSAEDREPRVEIKGYDETNVDRIIRILAGEVRHWYRNHTGLKAETSDFIQTFGYIDLEDGTLVFNMPPKTYSNNVCADASFVPKDREREAIYWEMQPLEVWR